VATAKAYDDTFKQVFRRFYASIGTPDEVPEYPQFADGLRQLNIVNAALRKRSDPSLGRGPTMVSES